MNASEKNTIIESTKKCINQYNEGYLEMAMGYKFRTKPFLDILFLYINSVDTKNPDLLGANNKNTFVYEAQSQIRKIKEQVSLDIRDFNFLVPGASTLSRFVVKAANRKMLKDNNFAEVVDDISDDAVDYGSGFLKIWESKGELKMEAVDPFFIIFDQYNFKKGKKIERLRRTVREIVENKKYDKEARIILSDKTKEEDFDNEIVIYQTVQDFPDGTQEINVVDTDNDLIFYHFKTEKGSKKIVRYYKYDFEKRRGFPDALGIGCNERIFNKLVQSKINRERMDKVMEISSKLVFQKQIDNEKDNLVGKDFINIKDGVILAYKGNKLEPLNTDGIKQANLINQQLGEIINTIGTSLNMTDALLGKTLPSGTSGVQANLLTENASSVFKDEQEDYAKFWDMVYRESIIKWMIKVIHSKEDLRRYLDPNDIKIIELSERRYRIAMKYVDSVIAGEPFNLALAEQQVKNEIKSQGVISGDLLDMLKNEVEGIETYISGENFNKAQAVAFVRELRQTYATNPQILQDPIFRNLITKEVEYDAGLSGLEIEQLLEDASQLSQNVEQQMQATGQTV